MRLFDFRTACVFVFCWHASLLQLVAHSTSLDSSALYGLMQTSDWMEASIQHLTDRFDDISVDVASRWRNRLANLLETPHYQSDFAYAKRDRRSTIDVPYPLWHSYVPHTGVGNRQQLILHGVRAESSLNISGPAISSAPEWQVVDDGEYFFLFGLFSFNSTPHLHIVKTNLIDVFKHETVKFNAGDLRVKALLVRSAHHRHLYLFVKRSLERPYLHDQSDGSEQQQNIAEQIVCLSVDRSTLQMEEICAPVNMPAGETVFDLVAGSLYDPITGGEDVLVMPLQRSSVLLAYRLSALPSHHIHSLNLYTSVDIGAVVSKVQFFSVAGQSYLLIISVDHYHHYMLHVYRLGGEEFSVVQRVPLMSAVVDLQVFHIDFQWYLALAQEDSSTLFVWHVDRFESLQHDSAPGHTYRWRTVPVKSCRHELILAKVIDDRHGSVPRYVQFYIHNVQTGMFDEVPEVPCLNAMRQRSSFVQCFFSQSAQIGDFSNMIGVHRDNRTFILLPSAGHDVSVVRVDVSFEDAADPVFLHYHRLAGQKKVLQDRYDVVLSKLRHVETVLSDAVVADSDQVLVGSYVFSSPVTADSLDAAQSDVGVIHMSGFDDDVGSLLESVAALVTQTRHVQSSTEHLQLQINNLVYRGESSMFDGDKTFLHGVSVDSLYSLGHTQIHRLNGQHLNPILDNIVTVNSSIEIEGMKTLGSGYLVSDSLNVQLINGHRPESVMTSHSQQSVEGRVEFSSPLQVTNLTVFGAVNGVYIDDVLLLPETQSNSTLLNVSVVVDELVVDSIGVLDAVNNMAASSVFNVLLRQSDAAVFTGAVTLHSLDALQSVNVLGSLNGVNVESLLTSVLFTDETHSVSSLNVGHVRVSSGDLNVTTVNDATFPSNRHVLADGASSSSSWTLTGSKWLRCVRVRQFDVDTINNISLSRLVTLDTLQSVASLHVRTAQFDGGLAVEGSVLGVPVLPPANMSSEHVLADSDFLPHVTLVFDQSVMLLGNLQSAGVNGFASLDDLFSNVVERDSRTVFVSGDLLFAAAVRINSLTVGGSVSGLKPGSILTRDTPQVINGPVILDGSLTVSRGIVLGNVGAVNISRLLDNVIYTDSPALQIVSAASVRFIDSFSARSISLNGSLNGLLPEHVMWKHLNQLVYGRHAYIGHVHVHRLHVTGNLNVPQGATVAGLDFSILAENIIDNGSGDSNSTAVFTLPVNLSRLQLNGAVSVDRINGYDVRQLLTRLVGVATVVSGKWRLRRLHVHGDVTSQERRLNAVAKRAVCVSNVSVLSAELSFERLIVRSGGVISAPDWLLSGIRWSEVVSGLADDRESVTFINASIHFGGGVIVNGGLVSDDLPLHHLLTVDGDAPVTITADVVIDGDASFLSDVQLNSAINDVYDLQHLQQHFISDQSTVVDISRDVLLMGHVSVESLLVTGTINGHNMTALMSDAVPLNDADVTLSGHLNFQQTQVSDDVRIIDGIVNGQPLLAFLETVRRTDETSHVFSVPVFIEAARVSQLHVANLSVLGALNQHNLTALLQDAVYLSENLTLGAGRHVIVSSLLVDGNLQVERSINGIRHDQLLRLTSSSDRLQQLVLRIDGNVWAESVLVSPTSAAAGVLLNGYKYDALLDKLVPLNGDKLALIAADSTLFSGHVTINGALYLYGLLPGGVNASLLVAPSVDNVTAAQGHIQFSDLVTADTLILQATVAGLNISECFSHAVYPDEDVVMQGFYQLIDISTDVSDSPAIEHINDTIWQHYLDNRQIISQFNSNFSKQCSNLLDIYYTTGSTYLALRYFDLQQKFSWQLYGSIISFFIIEPVVEVDDASFSVLLTYRRSSDGCPETSSLLWHVGSGRLVRSRAIVAAAATSPGLVRAWQQTHDKRLIISAATRSSALHCSSSPLSSVWKWENGQLQFVQSLSMEATHLQLEPNSTAFYLLNSEQQTFRRFKYDVESGKFTADKNGTHSELLSVGVLADGSRVVAMSLNSTVSVHHHLTGSHSFSHVTALGALSASALHMFSMRGRLLLLVADSGWSSLVNRPQGIKVFEYLPELQHRCVPLQHLVAVEPTQVVHFTAGSLPDLFLAVLELNHGVRVFIDDGEAGFTEFQRLLISGARQVSIYSSAALSPDVRHSSGLLMLVSTETRLYVLEAHMAGHRLQKFNNLFCSAHFPFDNPLPEYIH